MLAMLPLLTLAACAPPAPPVVAVAPAAPAIDPLYRPARVVPGRLEYAPDRSTFAPILTERVAYPTQPEANDAYLRRVAGGPADLQGVTVQLFACKPGALDAQTPRVSRVRGPVVHCATDFVDGLGRPLGRIPVNFVYTGRTWTMQPVNAPRTLVPWLNREKSPRDRWSWVPGRDRYE